MALYRRRVSEGIATALPPEDGHSIMLRVSLGRSWKVHNAQTDQQGSATITLYDPTAEAYDWLQRR